MLVKVEGRPDEDGVWRIEATVRGIDPTDRLALVRGIFEQTQRARRHGMHSVRIFLDIDGDPREVSPSELFL